MNRLSSTLRIIATALLIVGWIECCVVFFSTPSFAQNAEPPTKEVKRSVLSMKNISNEMIEVNLRLREIENFLSDKAVSESIKQSIPLFRQEMLLLKTQFETVTYGKYGPVEIEELHTTWKIFHDRISTKGRQLDRQITNLNSWLNEIQQWHQLWERTKASAESKNAPQALMNDIKRTIQSLKSIEQKLVQRRNEMLILDGQIKEKEQSAQVILKKIDRLQSNILELFTVQQEEPLWRIRLAPEEFQKFLNLFVQELNFRIKEIEEYGSNHPLQLLLYGLLIIVMLLLTYWSCSTVKEYDARYSDNADREMSPLDTMASPLFYGLLLALILNVMIHNIRIDVPYGFKMGLIFLLVLVWLFVFSRILSRKFHAPIFGLAALIVIDIVRGSPRELQLITRLILTVELALSLVGALWIQQSGYFNKIGLFLERNMWLRVLKGWHLLNIALLSVGLAAVFSGYLILADRLVRQVLLGILGYPLNPRQLG